MIKINRWCQWKIVASLFVLLSMHKLHAQNIDLDILKGINPTNPSSAFWKTTSGSAYFVCAATPVYFLTAGIITNSPALRRKAVHVFGAIVVELVVSESMKDIFKRKRPGESYPGIIFPYSNASGRSFPSGHTSLAFATAASVAIQCKKWYITVPAYAYAACVGYSRMYLGVHYPSDVLAGAAVGIGSAYLSHWLTKKLFGTSKMR